MKTKTDTKHTPLPRDGSALNWLVVNPDGRLLAVLDSESEAYFFTKNRGHAEGAVYFKAPCDYAAAPELLAALQAIDAAYDSSAKHGHPIAQPLYAAVMSARAVLARGGYTQPLARSEIA